MICWRRLLLFAAFLFAGGATAAGQSDPRAVLEEYERRQNEVRSEVASIEMAIFGPGGNRRTRKLDAYSLFDRDDRMRSLIIFTDPADIRGTGLLTIETEAGDDQRLYLPALGRVQRIAGARRSERFAGSDFTYEDLGTRNPDDYELTMLEETDRLWRIEAVPRKRDSQYGRIVFSVDRERFVLSEVAYTDRRGRPWKELIAEDFTELKPGVWRPRQLTMHDLKEGRRTELRFLQRRAGAALAEDFFSERQLRRGGR